MKKKRVWVEPNPKHPRGEGGRFVKRGTAVAKAVAPAPAGATRTLASDGPFYTITPDEAEAMQRKMTARQPWTAKQRTELRRYTGDDYVGINGVARTGQGSATDRAAVPVMRSAMREIFEDITLTRSIKANTFGMKGLNGGNELSDREAAQLAGRTFHEKGFSSASVGSRGNTLRLSIKVPKGTRGAYVDSISKNRGETEMVLDLGTHYRIDRVERHLLKGTIIHVTVVGQDA